jgi:hypothetical protein
MNRFITMSAAAASLVLSSVVVHSAEAQTAKDLTGTWRLVSSVIAQGSTKVDTFGPNPSGVLIFGSDGHYVLTFLRHDLPKVASGSRTSETPEEARAIAQGSVSSFGSYTVDDKVIVLRIEDCTFPNWRGAEQRRPFSLSGDELTYTSPGTTGVATQVTLRRVK